MRGKRFAALFLALLLTLGAFPAALAMEPVPPEESGIPEKVSEAEEIPEPGEAPEPQEAPAETEEFEPFPDPEPTGVFQSGAMEGPQTIPRPSGRPEPPALAAAAEKAAYPLSGTVLQEAGAAVDGLTLPVERLLMLHDYLVDSGRVPREDSAAAYQALLAEYVPQVPCWLIQAQAGGHTWNLVQLDGNWYHVDAALDTPENQPGRCFHTYFLVSDGVLRWHEHPEWDQSLYPACTDETYQENYQYAYSSHVFTRRDGRFLYLRDNGDGAVEGMSFTAQLFETDSLLREGRGPERALGVLSERGALWLGNCLYYITYTLKPEMSYCLMIYDRTSGAVAQGPVFDLPRDAGIGVLHDSASGEVRAVSTKDGSVFAAPSPPSPGSPPPGGRAPAASTFWSWSPSSARRASPPSPGASR